MAVTLDRAATIDPDSEDLIDVLYDDDDHYNNAYGIRSPLRVSLEGGTRFMKDANGWTHLIKDGAENNNCYHGDPVASTTPTEMTLDDVRAKYAQVRDDWKGSSQHEAVLAFLRGTILEQDIVIDRCVVACLGTFTAKHPYCPGERSMSQLALLDATLETLGEKHDIGNVYIQDPAMNSLDRAFVESKGFIVLTDPEAFNLITTTSLLFAIGFEWSVIGNMFEIAYPAMFIGGALRGHLESWTLLPGEGYTEEQERLRQDEHKASTRRIYERVYEPFHENWDSQEIPIPPEGSNIRVYWKGRKFIARIKGLAREENEADE